MPDYDPLDTLDSYLAKVRRDSGAPSLRALAARTDYSHTSVAKVFTDDATSVSWPIIEQVVLILGADTDRARQLWSHDDTVDQKPTVSDRHPQARLVAIIIWCAILVTGGIAIAVIQAVDGDITHATYVTDLVQGLFGAGTTVALGRHIHEAHKTKNRLSVYFFGWLTAGVAFWTAGQAAWFVARNVWNEPVPTGHIHDVGFLLMPVCVGIALWLRASHLGWSALSRWWHRTLSLLCLLCATYAANLLMLTFLDLQVGFFELVATLYPATDFTLALLAIVPLVFGYRIVGSVVLTTALLAVGASDIGYLILKADPATDMLPAPAALGYIGFTATLSLYAFVILPLPKRPRKMPRRLTAAIPRTIIDGTTALATTVAVGCSAGVLCLDASFGVRFVAMGLGLAATCALALRLVLPDVTTAAPTSRPT